MLSNYLKIAWRSLRNNRSSSIINIGGLAVGMAVAMLIGLWIWDEVSFDHWHTHHARIVQLMDTQMDNGRALTSGQVAIPLRNELENKYGSNFKQLVLSTQPNQLLMVAGDKKINRTGLCVQPGFPSLFTLKMLAGNADALKDPSSILLSRSTATALFGDNDPMNKSVSLAAMVTLKVAGVYDNLPANTTLANSQFLIAWDKFITLANMQQAQEQWGNHSFLLYGLLTDQADITHLNTLIRNIPDQHMPGSKESVFLHPMDRWHLYDEFKDGKEAGGRIKLVWLFSIIGAFVLLLACINFMNLSTARSEKRAREVGIRKAIGSLRGQLVRQFLIESLLMAAISAGIAVLLVQATLPFFNRLADKSIVLPYNAPQYWFALAAFTVVTGLLAGSYPAFYLSAFKPAKVLKGAVRAGRGANLPRQVLVVLQFTVSVALILGTLIVYRQVLYARDRPVGYNRDGLVSVILYSNDAYKSFGALREELMATGVVQDVAGSSSPSTKIWNNYGDLDWEGKDPRKQVSFGTIAVTHDFGRTLGWQIKQGRDFSRDFQTDTGSFIINATAASLIGFPNPVGKTIKWQGKDHRIAGVVKDLLMEDPFEPVKPTVFFLQYNDWLNYVTVRLKPGQPLTKALATIEPAFKKYNAGGPFDYQLVDQEYARKFANEQRIGSLATVFAVLAIFISCLGLFGLVSFTAEQRSKEIGIRKVLGASVSSIWRSLSREFVLLVAVACCIAGPLSYYFMHSWLQQYTYRTPIHWWLFAASIAGALLITLATVSIQAVRAALVNPVKSLRSE